MSSNKRIENFQFINLPYTRADEMIKMTAEFIAELAKTRDVSIFQSAFGFMNNDIPFTMLIRRKKFDTNIFEVFLEVNDWGTFGIEDEDFFPAKEWHLRCDSNKLQVPNWEDLTAYEIYQKISIMERNYGVATISGEDATPLIDMITMMLMEEYVDGMRPQDWPCDIIEAHVAMIYSEKHMEMEHKDISKTDGVSENFSSSDFIEVAKNFSEYSLYTDIVNQLIDEKATEVDRIIFDCFRQHLGCKKADDVFVIVTSHVMFHHYNDILPYINERLEREIGPLGSSSGKDCLKLIEIREPVKATCKMLAALRKRWKEVYNEN